MPDSFVRRTIILNCDPVGIRSAGQRRRGCDFLGWRSVGCLLFLFAIQVQPMHAQWIVAHRGASHDAPENTLAAFRLAWDQGADAVEADFRLTQDRKILCIHDDDSMRTTGVKRTVAEHPLEAFRKLDAGGWRGDQFRGEQLPTFAEVLSVVPEQRGLVVELKTGPEIVPVLVEEIERLDAPKDYLILISFNADTIAACKQQLPEVQAHWLTSFKRDDDGRWTPTADSIADVVTRCGADGVGMRGERAVIDQAFIDRLRQGGCESFHVWTVDSPEDARFFQSLGAVAVTTNRPAFIRERLEEDNGRSLLP